MPAPSNQALLAITEWQEGDPIPDPNKALGQHFLVDKNIIAKIIKAINPQPEEVILEIGPGPGALTTPMLAVGAHILAVEKDPRFKGMLTAMALSRHGELEFILEDALRIHWPTIVPKNAKVVGNLPYNVGTMIVLNLLQQRAPASEMIFMLQKEVVDRFLAPPSTKARGRISIWCELLSDTKRLFNVPRGAFNPQPKVTSAMMHLRPLKKPRYAVNMAVLKTILNDSFNQRRKMLRSSLKHLLTSSDMLEAGVKPTDRPENLTTKQFCALANKVP